MAALERTVLRIDRPEVQQGMTPQHRVRPLMPAAMRGDFAATDPFLALMEDWFPRGVFGKHPHRGIETVTYVIEGRVDHYDNQGHEGVIGPGDVQWMTAGRGLIHNEIPAEGVVVHSLQLWVNLPAADKMTAPRYQDLPADYNAVVVVLEGAGALGAQGASIRAGDVAWLTRRDDAARSETAIQAGDVPLRALLYAGRPLREPAVAGGPFVMNTEAQIQEAYADYRAGRFGPA